MLEHVPGLPWLAPYRLTMALALFAVWWWSRRRAVSSGIDTSHIDLLLPLTFVAGAALMIAVATPMAVRPPYSGDALAEPLRLPSYVLATLLVLLGYGRAARVSVRRLADAMALPALLGVAIVRIGCFCAGCCFGDVVGHTDALAHVSDPQWRLQVQTLPALSPEGLPWAVQFPAGSFAYRQQLALGLVEPGDARSLPVHPVQLYESTAVLLLCLVLWRLQRQSRRPGTLALAALAGYALIAFGLQFLRAGSPLLLGPLTAAQLAYLAGLVGLAALMRREDDINR